MVDVVTLIAVALLVAGVIGTLVPMVPGGLCSLAGVYSYWWATDFSEPGVVAMAVFTILGLTTLFVELFGSAIAGRVGGASWKTTGIAVVVGLVLMVVTGPLGLLVGIFGTVFVLELARHGAVDRGIRTAAYATVGIFVSTAVQVALTTTILFGFVLVVIIL